MITEKENDTQSKVDGSNKQSANNIESSFYSGNDASSEIFEIALEEYRHVLDRANRHDNKVYIMITLCGFFFAFLLNLFDKLIKLDFPKTKLEFAVSFVCILFFLCVSICYITCLVLLISCLHPKRMKRLNPHFLFEKSLWNKPPYLANMSAAKLYTEFVIQNNMIIDNMYKKISIITKLMSVVLIVSFIEYIILSIN